MSTWLLPCQTCGGTGLIEVSEYGVAWDEPCPDCNATGKAADALAPSEGVPLRELWDELVELIDEYGSESERSVNGWGLADHGCIAEAKRTRAAIDTKIAQIRAALRSTDSAPAVSPDTERLDWRPIETAPRDGAEIVCYLGGPSMASVEDPDHRFRVLYWSTSYSIFGLGGCWTDGLCTLGDRIDATHWMPLPAPPARSTPVEEDR